MATPSAIAKRAAKQTAEILEAVKVMVAEVGELKAEIARPLDAVELEAGIDETTDRTDEILTAIGHSTSFLTAEMTNTKAEIAELKAEIAELKEQMTPAMKPPARRKK